jgi:NTE family protein
MEVLEAENIAPDLVVGCSGGAVFGGAIAQGFSSMQLAEACARTWTPEIARRLDWRSLLKIALPKLFGFRDRIGVFDDRVMTRNLGQALGAETTFADTRMPFYCVATDFHTGAAVVISQGNMVRAVRASSGIPVVFPPVELDGRLLIDGGLSNPLPVDVAIQNGADLIIAMGFETSLMPSVATPGNYAAQMFSILVNQLLYRRFAFYNLAYHSEIIALVPEFDRPIGINSVESVDYVVEQGRLEARKHLPYLKRLLASLAGE